MKALIQATFPPDVETRVDAMMDRLGLTRPEALARLVLTGIAVEEARVPNPPPTAAGVPMARDAAIEASARIAHEAERALHASRDEPVMPAWVDLLPDMRERQVLRAERLLSLSGKVAGDDRFVAAVVRAAAGELGARAVRVRAASVRAVDPLDLSALEAIARATAKARGTTVKALLGNDRTRAVTTVRNLAMLIARRDFRITVEAIGCFFGGRDHATVTSNVASMENWLLHDEELRATRAHICDELRRAGVTPHAVR